MATLDVQVLERSFTADQITEGDGRTITGRCVPYDTPADVRDTPDGPTYREVWRRSVFRNVVKSPNRTTLNYGHSAAMSDLIGHALDLTEESDGLWATFRALPGPSGDQGLELIRAGIATGLSIHAWVTPRGSRYGTDGTVERVKAERLPHVALTMDPAYTGAGVTAVRSSSGRPGVEVPDNIAEILAYTASARAQYPRD